MSDPWTEEDKQALALHLVTGVRVALARSEATGEVFGVDLYLTPTGVAGGTVRPAREPPWEGFRRVWTAAPGRTQEDVVGAAKKLYTALSLGQTVSASVLRVFDSARRSQPDKDRAAARDEALGAFLRRGPLKPGDAMPPPVPPSEPVAAPVPRPVPVLSRKPGVMVQKTIFFDDDGPEGGGDG